MTGGSLPFLKLVFSTKKVLGSSITSDQTRRWSTVTSFWRHIFDSQGSSKPKPSVYSGMNLLHQKQVLLIRNLGKMLGLTVEITHCRAAVTEPSQILKFTEKYPKPEGAVNNRRYFLLMLPKEITSEAFCQALIAAVAHCLRREHSWPQGDCTEDVDRARAAMPAQEGALVWVRCSHSHPPTSQSCYQQGTWQSLVTTGFFPAQGHKSQTMKRNRKGRQEVFLFRQQTVTLKKTTQLPIPSWSPENSCTEQQDRAYLLQHLLQLPPKKKKRYRLVRK